jgi:phage shock protein PspC (stress-responsive transcriptional regulator)
MAPTTQESTHEADPGPGPGFGGGGAPPPAAPHKRLYRRTDNKVIAGVASGLGDYFNVDPVIVRIAFVLLAFAGGAGIIAYGVMWWIVPPTYEVSNPGENAIRRLKGAPMWVAIVLMVIGGLLLADQLGGRNEDVVWGLGLVAIGVLLFWQTSERREERGHVTPVPPPAPPYTPPPRQDTAEFSGSSATTAPAPVPSPPAAAAPVTEPTWGRGPVPPPDAWARTAWAPPVRIERRRREPSGLGLATLGLAFVVVGVVAVLHNAGAFDVTLTQYAAIALTVLALGLLVGTWFGRARWLALLAVPLVPLILLSSLVTVPFAGGFGERSVQPQHLSRSSVTYRRIAGVVNIDLGRLVAQAGRRPPGAPLTITASVVAGDIDVFVPRAMLVHVDGRIGAGSMTLLGVYADGVNVHRAGGQSTEKAQVDLRLAVSFGHILVFRSPT